MRHSIRCALVLVSLAGVSSEAAEKAKKPEPAAKARGATGGEAHRGLLVARDRPVPRRPRRRGRRRRRAAAASTTSARTGGGVWKTTDGGVTWKQRLRRLLRTGSVGAVAVARVGPERRLRRHGRETRPRQRLARRRRLQVDRRRQDLDARRPRATRGTSAASASTRRTPTSSTSPRSGHLFGPNKERGVFRSKDGGKTWEQVLFVDDEAGRRRPGHGPDQPAHPLRRAPGSVQRTPWSLESGGPGSGLWKSDRRRRHLERSSRATGLPKGTLGHASASRSRRRTRTASGRSIEAEDGGVFRSDDARRDLERDQRRPQPAPARLVLHPHLRRPEERRRRSTCSTSSSTSRSDGGKTFTRRSARRTATTTTSGSTRRPAAHDRRQRRRRQRLVRRRRDAGRRSGQPADRAVLPRHRPTTRSRTASTARSRTTRRSRSASRSDGGGIDATRLGRRSAAARAATSRRTRTTRTSSTAAPTAASSTRYDHRTGAGPQRHRLAGQPDGPRAPRHEVPLPVELPDRVLAARPEHALRRAATCSSARPNEGQSWEADQPRPDAQRQDEARPVRRADHQGQHQRRVLRHDLRARRVAAREGRALGRLATTACVHVIARRRQELDERHAARTCPSGRMINQHRGLARTTRARPVPRRDPLQARRLPALPVQDDRLRQDLDEDRRRASPDDAFTRVVRAGPEAARPALRRHRDAASTSRSTTARTWQPLAAQPAVVPITDLVVRTTTSSSRRRAARSGSSTTSRRCASRSPSSRARRPSLPALAGLPLRRAGEGRGAVGKNPPYGARRPLPAQGGAEGGRGGQLEILDAHGQARPQVLEQGGDERGAGRRRRRRPAGPPGAEAAARPRPASTASPGTCATPRRRRFKGLILWAGQTPGPRVVPGPLPGAPDGRGHRRSASRSRCARTRACRRATPTSRSSRSCC